VPAGPGYGGSGQKLSKGEIVARVVELSVPPERTGSVLSGLKSIGALSVPVFRGASVQPPGDIVAADVRNNDLACFMRLADEVGLGADPGVSLTTTQPMSVVSSQDPRLVTRDSSVSTWEEMSDVIGRESTMTPLKALLLLGSGLIAALGIWAGAVHIVIGALIIAPAYEPIVRLVLGAVTRRREPLVSVVKDTLVVYAALVLGGFVGGLLLRLFAADPLAGPDAYVRTDTLLSYWSTLTWTSAALSLIAGVLGSLLILLDRTVLTAGVVIVLALVPAATIVGVGLSAGELELAVSALGRWAVDVGLVLLTAAAGLGIKRRVDQRSMSGGGRTGAN
jgi:hypothetical protein